MAFKKRAKLAAVPDSPDKLLLELPRRKIPDVLPHQREVMREYVATALGVSDVALQLPTGSGKTLVGLLIAEWRRRKFNERVVYLCPTRQLVHQTVEQGEDKYGLSALPFTGRIKDYAPDDRASYRNADRIAVTTYSSLFNTNPFFNDADIVIVDDAHAAESYIASMWSLRIDRAADEHAELHSAIAGLVKPFLDPVNFVRLTGEWQAPSDKQWVDKLPTPDFLSVQAELAAIIDAHAEAAGLVFEWSSIRDHINGCQLYLSAQDILLRPLIPPTWSHAPFCTPKQRIFMSATLGAGGDLERLSGRKNIKRLSIPEGWERQGVGRRFFIFPEMALKDDEINTLRMELIKRVDRSLVLVPSQTMRDEIADEVETELGYKVFGPDEIEQSKQPFVTTKNAVAVIANRYDGIDFPGDECRLLFIDGLPRATNSQERFLMSRMGANVLFNERLQTRVLQAIGRCTRSLEDYSAVVITGEELSDYLADIRRRKFFHPELQAEIGFGVDQSKGVSLKDIVDNFKVFIENGEAWEEVNKDIVAERDAAKQESFPAIDELAGVVGSEIDFQKALWQGDYDTALEAAEAVIAGLKVPELKGYRALWHYLAGSAAWLAWKAGAGALEGRARAHFGNAKKAASGVPWLVSLARFQPLQDQAANDDNRAIMLQIENVENVLSQIGVMNEARFAAREKSVLDGLASAESGPFEEAHRLLGELIGFKAGNSNQDAAPDPWWISHGHCFVFEDHQGANNKTSLGAEKARQAASHPNWIKKHVEEANGMETTPVLVSPCETATDGALPHLDTVSLWPLDEFKKWAQGALSALREVRRTFSEPGDLAWRAQAIKVFEANGLDASTLAKMFRSSPALKKFKKK